MSNLPTKMDDMLKGLQAAKARMSTASAGTGADFLRLTKLASWEYGADSVEVQDGSQWAINPKSFEMGYIAWGDSSNVLGEAMAPAYDAPIVRSELADVGANWADQYSIQLACVSGEDTGQQVVFKSTAKGARDEIQRVLTALLLKVENGDSDIVPIINLKNSSYKHKKYGTIITPVLDIVKWEKLDASTVTEDEPEAELEVQEQPPKRRRRKVA